MTTSAICKIVQLYPHKTDLQREDYIQCQNENYVRYLDLPLFCRIAL